MSRANRGAAALISKLGPECRECYAFAQWMARRYPEAWGVTTHIPNERQSKMDRIILGLLGTKGGASDYVCAWPTRAYVGMWLEFKRTGATWTTVSADQRAWLDAMAEHGWFTAVAYGIDHALEVTVAYLEGHHDVEKHRHGAARSYRGIHGSVRRESRV